MIKIDDLNEFKKLSTDKIDWKNFGGKGMGVDDTVIEIWNNSKGKSNKRVNYSIMSPPTCILRTQGSEENWPGNFIPGAGMRLLVTNTGKGGSIRVLFDTPVKGFGAQFQQLYGIGSPPKGSPFTAFIRGFKKGDSSPIDMHFGHGWSDNGRHKAVFLGMRANGGAEQIDYVQFDTEAVDPNDNGEFAIGTMYLIV